MPMMRIAVLVNPPKAEYRYYPVPDIRTAVILANAIANEHLALDALCQEYKGEGVIDSNIISLEVFQNGEWNEFEDGDGNTLDDYELDEELKPVIADR